MLLGDDDNYEVLPEYTKDNYFLFKMNDGKFFRIPKGRVSSVVGGIARRALESSQGKDVDWNALIDTAVNQMAPNNPLSDNILAPIIQAKINKAWYGGDIVSSRLQKLPNAEQFDESTDKLSKFLGEKLNISPKKINYVLDQYSGGIGDVVLPMLTPQAENNILEDKFTTDSVMKNKHVSEYYSLLDELEKIKIPLILANSNWTTNEKDKIYTQIINDDDETYAVLKKLDSSKSIINQYLDYLQNDFKADREDDGTEKGKAISGSKKKKVYNYSNGIDSNNMMSYTQRLYLTGVNTSLSSSDKKKIVDYINKSNSFSKKEKLEAINKLQGVTVYKDGRISW